MSTLIVVPTFNEAENLRALASRVLARPEQSLLIVDDNSPDGTGVIADSLVAEWPGRVRVLHRARKGGLGTAYVAGFRAALEESSDFIVQMDADFSHDPDEIPRLVKRAADADVVIGSRYVKGGGAENWPVLRRIISRGGSLYTQALLGLPVSDPTSGFRCFRREALAELDLSLLQARGFGFQVEMCWLCHQVGLRQAEAPIRFVDRRLGESKMSSRIFFEAMWLVWFLRFHHLPHPPPRPPVTVR